MCIALPRGCWQACHFQYLTKLDQCWSRVWTSAVECDGAGAVPTQSVHEVNQVELTANMQIMEAELSQLNR